MVCSGIRPRLEDVKPEVRELGLDGDMWKVVVKCWQSEPRKRGSSAQLCDGLAGAAMRKAQVKRQVTQRVAALTPPRIVQISSPLVPTENGKLRKRPSPRPHPHSHSDSSVLRQNALLHSSPPVLKQPLQSSPESASKSTAKSWLHPRGHHPRLIRGDRSVPL